MPIDMRSERDGSSEIVLRSSWKKWSVVLAISVAFVVMAASRPASPIMWFSAGFFGLCGAVALLVLVIPNRLIVTATGMTLVQFFRRRTYEWAKCGAFRVWSLPLRRNNLVVFDYADIEQKKNARFNNRLAGAN